MATVVYKICTQAEWRSAQAAGQFGGSQADARDGFIHLSTAAQLAGTARRHFKARRGLVALAVNVAALGPALRWERARGGDLFPHLYGPLPLDAVAEAVPLDELLAQIARAGP